MALGFQMSKFVHYLFQHCHNVPMALLTHQCVLPWIPAFLSTRILCHPEQRALGWLICRPFLLVVQLLFQGRTVILLHLIASNIAYQIPLNAEPRKQLAKITILIITKTHTFICAGPQIFVQGKHSGSVVLKCLHLKCHLTNPSKNRSKNILGQNYQLHTTFPSNFSATFPKKKCDQMVATQIKAHCLENHKCSHQG